MRSIKWCHFQ